MSDNAAQRGFTLVELVTMLVILAILSSVALPKFFRFSDFQERALFDDTLNAIRYAQKLALVTGCNVQVTVSSDRYTLNRPAATDRSQCTSLTAADFTRAVPHPSSGEPQYSNALAGISITAATFYFTALGTASADLDIYVGSNKLTVVRATGFVYDSTP